MVNSRYKFLHLLIACCIIACSQFALPAMAQDSKFTSSYSWSAPTARENGTPLAASEIGGYDFQYKLTGSATATNIKLDASKTTYDVSLPAGEYEIKLAVFDKNGLYSKWVSLTVRPPSPPLSPNNFKVVSSTLTPIATGQTLALSK